jgi:aldehyde:ferredoxin oxidoreductase
MIGPGGEKMARTACVINDLRHAAGRRGLGAVMGSKHLKAIAARGKTSIPVGDQEALQTLAKWMRDHWKEKSWGMHDLGTPGGIMDLQEAGQIPTRNFQDGQFEGAGETSGEALRDTLLIDREGCFACPIRCKRVVKVDEPGMQVNPIYGGPEYETIGAFGSNCGVGDLKAVSKCHEICSAYSLDTISTGMLVSFAMECYEKGLLSREDTGGLDLHFGNGAATVELTQMIAERRGLGDLLAEGPVHAARVIGGDAHLYNIHVKGQPFPMHERRTRHGQALGYAVSPTGADHMHNFWDAALAKDPVGDGLQNYGVYGSVPQTTLNATKVRAYTFDTNWRWVHNHLGHCMFIPWSKEQIVDLVNAITGWKTNAYELMKVGERGVTMARMFNLREAWTRRDDVLPPRMNQPFVTETVNERPVDPEVLDEHLSMFYAMMGWDPETGVPTCGKLQELDIEWTAE